MLMANDGATQNSELKNWVIFNSVRISIELVTFPQKSNLKRQEEFTELQLKEMHQW